MSEEPVTLTSAITAAAAVASAASGIVAATSKPDEPSAPKPVVNRQALQADRARAAAAQGRSSTVVAGQKLGNVGNIG
jgi:hypothetical protein